MAGARRGRPRLRCRARCAARFEAEHQRLFGHIQPGGRIDITALRVVGRIAARLDAARRALAAADAAQGRARRARSGSIAAHGWQDVPVYDGADLRPGCTLTGPLLIEERTTTAFVGPRDTLERRRGASDFLFDIAPRPSRRMRSRIIAHRWR